MKNGILLIFLLAGLIQGCSEYNRVVKSDDYMRKFELANELYERKQWLRCVTLYEQVYQRMPKTGQGEVSYYRLGKAYFTDKDYYMGGYYLNTFAEKFPASPKCEETTFLSAICSVKNSPEYSLDQQETELALNDLQLFINKYPYSELIDTCNIIMDGLRYKLEKKDYESIKLYSKTDTYKSAVVASETFLTDYPNSVFREEIYYILLRNGYFLAINSIENKKVERIEKAIERYHTFVAEFPQSSYKKDAEADFAKLEQELKNLTNTKQ